MIKYRQNSKSEYGVRAGGIITMVPGQRPVKDGLLVIRQTQDGPRISDVGPFAGLRKSYKIPVKDLGNTAIAPGLINAHTHLELSHLAGKTRLGHGFVKWLQSLVPLLSDPPDLEALDITIQAVQDNGTVFVADMAGKYCCILSKLLEANSLEHYLMVQHFGFKTPLGNNGLPHMPFVEDLPDDVRTKRLCFSGHAFYSTHPKTLKRVKAWTAAKKLPFSLHLAECVEEVEFLDTGQGDLADFFRAADILPNDYRAPGRSPVQYAENLGLLDKTTLAVHCVHLTDQDITTLAHRKTNVCLCPRSNALIGVGRGRWEDLHNAGINICIGTDSLVSNNDLNLWNELSYFKKRYRNKLSQYELLAMLTVNPASALGISRDYGTLEKGKRAMWCTVPEEFLSKG
ncbi:MAG: amidohydrolase family protein [Thermodesulfobacteriota bacterium]|nr:amidohydrolase family protein [Thermodesulfobacteriota bacterium]